MTSDAAGRFKAAMGRLGGKTSRETTMRPTQFALHAHQENRNPQYRPS